MACTWPGEVSRWVPTWGVYVCSCKNLRISQVRYGGGGRIEHKSGAAAADCVRLSRFGRCARFWGSGRPPPPPLLHRRAAHRRRCHGWHHGGGAGCGRMFEWIYHAILCPARDGAFQLLAQLLVHSVLMRMYTVCVFLAPDFLRVSDLFNTLASYVFFSFLLPWCVGMSLVFL